MAYKAVYLKKLHEEEKKRGSVVIVNAKPGKAESVKSEDVSGGDGNDAGKKVGSVWTNTPWRFSSELPRAALGTVAAGIGYLL